MWPGGDDFFQNDDDDFNPQESTISSTNLSPSKKSKTSKTKKAKEKGKNLQTEDSFDENKVNDSKQKINQKVKVSKEDKGQYCIVLKKVNRVFLPKVFHICNNKGKGFNHYHALTINLKLMGLF